MTETLKHKRVALFFGGGLHEGGISEKQKKRKTALSASEHNTPTADTHVVRFLFPNNKWIPYVSCRKASNQRSFNWARRSTAHGQKQLHQRYMAGIRNTRSMLATVVFLQDERLRRELHIQHLPLSFQQMMSDRSWKFVCTNSFIMGRNDCCIVVSHPSVC